jgi:UDP-N-acetylglucosamine 2-epimerase (non-hydrolysing)
MNKTRITTILGTRPELIRLSVIIDKLDKIFEHRLVHTGQNSDINLSDVFFKELQIRKPDLHLGISNSSLGKFLGNLLPEIELELEKNPPDAVLILGDTNSAFAGIIAKRKGIPVYHLEAGNRSFDQNIPEEINRRVVDHFADFNLAYTSNAKDNLLREGLQPRNTAVIGSPLCEVISNFSDAINSSKILKELKIETRKYFLVSMHRQENIDNPLRLTELIQSLNEVARNFSSPIIISTHPRTKSKLDLLTIEINPLLVFHEPFGFIDYCKLQKEARIVFSDSGSVSEESVILGFKAITIRDSMERPEALESGSIVMSGIKKQGVIESITVIEAMPFSESPPIEYSISDTSTRVINFITSTIHQHSFWNGLRKR